MRILHIINKINSNSITKNIVESANFLQKLGHDAHIITGEVNKIVLVDTKNLTIIPKLNSNNIFSILSNVKKILNFCAQNQFDIIHIHSFKLIWVLKYITPFLSAKTAFTFYYEPKNTAESRSKMSFIMKNINTIITTSDYVKNNISHKFNINPHLIEYIPKGLNVNYFNRKKISHTRLINAMENYGIKEDNLVIIVSICFSSKDYKQIIASLKMLKNINFLAYFIDTDDTTNSDTYKKRIEKNVKKLKLDNRIFCTNKIQDVPAVYALADIFIYTSSKTISCARDIYESGIMGNIILASKIANTADFIHNKLYGFLFNQDDTLSLSQKILYVINNKIIENEAYRTNVSQYFISQFDINKCIQQELGIYTKILISTDNK